MVTLAAVALLSGCAVGPDFHRPTGPTVTGYTRQPLAPTTASTGVAGGEEQRFVPDRDIPEQWWTLFQSPALNAVIDKALAANPTLVSAQAALRQARELVSAQRGFFYPTVQGTFTGTRQQTSGTLSPILNSNSTTFNLYTAQATVGYAFDVWGGNRRQVESLQAQADAQRFLLTATYVTLTANVVAAAVQQASLRAQLAATQDIIAISTKSLALLRKQFELGYVAGLDVAAQEAALAQVQQQLPPLQKQLEQNRDLLAALTGRFPQDDLDERFELAQLHLPQDLPVSLPSQLVEQRPDVRVAEETLHAAGAQVGVAIANWLPQFTISATYGGSATDFAQMFAHSNPYWMVGGTVLQTLFDGNTLLHRQRAAAAAFEQAAAQYRSTVLTAVQNVADTLYALQADAESLTAAVAAERAAKRTLDLTLKQQQLGYTNYLALLSAQQAYQQTVITRVQAQANRFTDTGALYLALGGGWWNRPDAAAAPPTDPPAERH
ncbi:MAG TPA: efflux transporter outer membrane subunit [Methylomirabilota bacterium]|nr:efflux transporter outer membrane subunit [Methylomirabilota bacterium]